MMRPSLQRMLYALILVSASLNGVQATRLYWLSLQQESIWARHELKVGDVVPPLTSLDKDGSPVTVVAERPIKPVLLYWMSPFCGWCSKNEANFRAIVSAASEYDVVAVSAHSDGLAEFVANTLPPYTVVGPPELPGQEAYRFRGTPMTIVISPERRVRHIWTGAYQGTNLEEIEALFQVKLPGLLR